MQQHALDKHDYLTPTHECSLQSVLLVCMSSANAPAQLGNA